jgi:hypothetical protein
MVGASMLEYNYMINRFIEAMGATGYKTYRIYNRRIAHSSVV